VCRYVKSHVKRRSSRFIRGRWRLVRPLSHGKRRGGLGSTRGQAESSLLRIPCSIPPAPGTDRATPWARHVCHNGNDLRSRGGSGRGSRQWAHWSSRTRSHMSVTVTRHKLTTWERGSFVNRASDEDRGASGCSHRRARTRARQAGVSVYGSGLRRRRARRPPGPRGGRGAPSTKRQPTRATRR